MPTIRALFWDVGGVLLTNAWDHNERSKAFEKFHLDGDEFQSRHESIVSSFEQGRTTLDEYLDRTVFYQPRAFTKDEFRQYMFSLSQPFPENLRFAQALADSGRYFMGTINNESRELNAYRIATFELRRIFRAFFSSCYLGLRKPEVDIYRVALDVTQLPAEECCFIDDRAPNLVEPANLGMRVIQMEGLEQLRTDLLTLGVQP